MQVYLRTEFSGSKSRLFVKGIDDPIHEIDLVNPLEDSVYRGLINDGISHIDAMVLDAGYSGAFEKISIDIAEKLGVWGLQTAMGESKEKKMYLLVYNRELESSSLWPYKVIERINA